MQLNEDRVATLAPGKDFHQGNCTFHSIGGVFLFSLLEFIEGTMELYTREVSPLSWRYSVPIDQWPIFEGALCRLRHNINVQEGHVNGTLYRVRLLV